MNVVQHTRNGIVVAEITAVDEKVSRADSALDLFASAQYSGRTNRIVLHAGDLDASFFDLATGLAGEILQKISNYQLRLAIVGDFSAITSRALAGFIRESNEYGQVLFVPDVETALARLC